MYTHTHIHNKLYILLREKNMGTGHVLIFLKKIYVRIYVYRYIHMSMCIYIYIYIM